MTPIESPAVSARPNRRTVLRRAGFAALALGLTALIGVVGAGVAVGATFDSMRKTLPDSEVFPSAAARPSAITTGTAASAQNILLLGSDTRGPAPTSLSAIRAQRSDTMLLVHIPADGEHVYVMSIMRDSWVKIPGHGMGKINSALAYGGVPLTVQVVENLTGVRIDHVAIISFSGFADLTNALGGVTVQNQVAFSNLGFDFPKGAVKLSGDGALAFVRARYEFADGDYQRVRNQQAYLAGVLKQVLSAGTLLDPIKLQKTVAAISPYLLVDRGFDAAYVAKLAVQLKSLRPHDIEYFTLPTNGTGMQGDQSVVYLDASGIAEVSQDLKNDTLDQYQPCRVSVCP